MSDRAARIRELFARDRYAQRLGVRLISDDPAAVVVAMTLNPDHENFFDMTHGGAIFSLADCALSLASNAAGDTAVAIDTHLVLTAPTQRDDELTATAEETTRGRTLGTYRITITRGDGRICGIFTGTVHIRPQT